MKKVVITGIGAVTPLGNTFAESWKNLKKGLSGIGDIEGIEISGRWKQAGLIKGFDAGACLSAKEIRRLDPFIHYAVASAEMAVKDAGIKGDRLISAGVIIGSSRGGIGSLERAYERLRRRLKVSPYLMPSTTVSMASSFAAQKLGIKGYSLGISNSCASGANAIGEAYRLIRQGIAQIVLAGGAEAPVCRLSIEGYGMTGALSKTGVMKPFDKKRDGFVLAEGASVLVLEEYESALRRDAKIYAEVIGYGNTVDAYHPTMPDSRGQANAIRTAIYKAGIKPVDVDYINAHATATPVGDTSEAEAIRLVFGKRNVPISAHKSMTGHMLGAGGAFEAALTAMSLTTGIIPPTMNLGEPEFNLNIVVKQISPDINIAISNSFGFGGVNAVLVFKKAGYDS